MKYLILFLTFAKIGMFTIGGGYLYESGNYRVACILCKIYGRLAFDDIAVP